MIFSVNTHGGAFTDSQAWVSDWIRTSKKSYPARKTAAPFAPVWNRSTLNDGTIFPDKLIAKSAPDMPSSGFSIVRTAHGRAPAQELPVPKLNW